MKNNNKIKSFILDYLKKIIPEYEKKGKLFTCPTCGKMTANIFPPDSDMLFCLEPTCGEKGDIFDLCRKLEFDNNSDVPKEDIQEHLIDMFGIKTDKRTDELLERYKNWQWDCVANEKNTKKSNCEKEWQKKNHKNIREWKQWLDAGYNLGVKTGAISGVTCIDFDFVESKLKKRIYNGKGTKEDLIEAEKQHASGIQLVKDKFPTLDMTTVVQYTFGGIHAFFKYEEDIPKSAFDYEGIHIDVQNDLGQIVIEPSIVGDKGRKIQGLEIKTMSADVKELILSCVKKPSVVEESKIIELGDGATIKGLDGSCNSTFLKVGGMFRKFMNVKQVQYALNLVNTNMLDDPMPTKSMRLMMSQIEKYHEIDLDTISNDIISHMQIVQDAHVKDLKECLGFERVDLEQALKYLCDHKKIYKIKKDLYRLIENIEWQEDFLSIGKPLEYDIPFLSKYNNFDNGSMSVVGAVSGTGKTHLTGNIIKNLINQGVYPYLLSVEGGGGFKKVVQMLGIKEGQFGFKIVKDPTKIPLEKNAVTIIDWLKAPDGEHYKTDVMYENINNQLIEKGGHVTILAQLKKQNKSFYAEDMVEHYASFVGKFLYPDINGKLDNLNPFIQCTKLRDSVSGLQYPKIPLSFNEATKEILLKS